MTTTHNTQRDVPGEPRPPHGAPGHVPAPRVTELSGHAYKRHKAFDSQLILAAVPQSFIKLDPRQVAASQVMFTVLVGTAVSAVACGFQIVQGSADAVFSVITEQVPTPDTSSQRAAPP